MTAAPPAAQKKPRKRDFHAAKEHQPAGGPEAAAFFDFDRTLLAGDAGVIFGRSLVEWGFQQSAKYAWKPARAMAYTYVTANLGFALSAELTARSLYKARLLKRSTLVRLAYGFLRGFPQGEMHERMKQVWESTLARQLYPEMKAIIDKHHALNQRVVIVTTGLRPIVELSRQYLGDHIEVVACEMGVGEDGFWTGTVVGPLYGAHKAEVVQDYARKHNIDLAKSYAYSDHYSDVEFLAAVGNPVCVNPQGRLRRFALRRSWKILDLPKPR